MGRKRTKPEYGYALVDDNGIYRAKLYYTRKNATRWRQIWIDLTDAKWRIVKFAIKPAK